MLKTAARKGMKVVFEANDGTRIVGKIDKVCPKNAKVQSTEAVKVSGRHYPVGTFWGAPYSLVEPLPASGNKNEVVFSAQSAMGVGTKTDIVPGVTTFRSHYADGNPLWKVISVKGRGVYLCRVIAEPDAEFEGDWVGTTKAFLANEIAASLGMAKLFENLGKAHDNFYDSLVPGKSIVHYNSGFNNFVRCEVVNVGGENKLKPVALVGKWREYDLPHYAEDGEIVEGYNAKMIRTGELFTPNASNIYENKARQGDIDPRSLPPLNLTLPEMTAEQKRIAALWAAVTAVRELLKGNDPAVILENVRTLVGQAAAGALVNVRDRGRKLLEDLQDHKDTDYDALLLQQAIEESEKVVPPQGLQTTLRRQS